MALNMDENQKAVETTQTAAPETTVDTSTVAAEDTMEARLAQLEVEKANYKLAFLKEKSKNKIPQEDLDDETDEERIERIVNEKLAATKIAQLDAEKEALLKQALKENKELKLASLSKNGTPPATLGAHSESQGVRDTLVTPDQLAAFKAKGWTDKDIERYKKNLLKYGTH